MKPDVSIIIASYNSAEFLGEAIESALAQSNVSTEVIVVDDGSEDRSREVAGRYPRITLLTQSRKGACAARNLGLVHCNSRYVVFLDGDDRMLPNACEIGLLAMAQLPNCAFAYGGFRRISQSGVEMGSITLPSDTIDHFVFLLLRNPIVLHSAIFLREAVMQAGGFDTADWEASDYDFYLRMSRDFPTTCHGKIIAERRIHDGQASRSHAPMLRSAIRVLDRQWKYTSDKPHARTALLSGRKHYQVWFGDKVVMETYLLAAQSKWRHAIIRLWILLRYHATGAMALARGLSKSNELNFAIMEDGQPDGLNLPSNVAQDAAFSLLSIEPSHAVRQGPLPRMQGNQGVLTIHCRGATSRTVLIFNDAPLETRFHDECRLTAFVPMSFFNVTGLAPAYLLRIDSPL